MPSETADHIWVPCRTVGYPKPFIQWVLVSDGDIKATLNTSSPKFHGKVKCLANIGEIVIASYKVYENGSLRIGDPYCEAQAEYENLTCIATSILGQDTKSHEFSLGKCK